MLLIDFVCGFLRWGGGLGRVVGCRVLVGCYGCRLLIFIWRRACHGLFDLCETLLVFCLLLCGCLFSIVLDFVES